MKIKKRWLTLFSLTFVAIAVGVAVAGEIAGLTCKNKACDYKGNVSFGGSMMFDRVDGYCVQEKKFTAVIWSRLEPGPKPMRIWNSQNGQFSNLYKCPDCGDPFLEIKKLEDLKHCPKCNEPTLEGKVEGHYD